MIAQIEATAIKTRVRRPVWHGEGFAEAVIRMDREIREAAAAGVDGTSSVFNPNHVPAMLAILRQQGFHDAKVNGLDNFRLEIHW